MLENQSARFGTVLSIGRCMSSLHAAALQLPLALPSASAGRTYERREPETTLLHRVVRDNLEEFLEHARETYAKPIPRYVERALRGYLKCGLIDAPPHIAHAMRVNHLSLIIGSGIGLELSTLQDLGVAALLHDLGYAAPEDISASCARLHHTLGHTVLGARMLASRRGFHEAKVRRG